MSLPSILRHARASKDVSQLELALRLGVSQRHVSFIETGRAMPSRELLVAWMQELESSTSMRNAALALAGFSNVDADATAAGDAAAAQAALQRMVQLHDPLPGIVFDPDWHALAVNRAGRWLCAMLMPAYCARSDFRFEGMDMIDAVADAHGLLSCARDAGMVGFALLEQLRSESWLRASLNPRVDLLAASLQRRFGTQRRPPSFEPALPNMNLRFDTSIGELRFATFQSAFGIPQDINASSLRIELWFPADARTRDVLRDEMAQAA